MSRPAAIQHLVVIGASLAGLRAAESARKHGFEGKISLVGDERHLPYDRPPLSKQYLKPGSDAPFFRTKQYLQDELGVDLLLGNAASGIDTSNRLVHLADGTDVPFDAAIICTGSSPVTVPAWNHLQGVFSLRTLDDAQRLKEALVPQTRIVIIGAGFIGAEIASASAVFGCHVTIVEAAETPLVRALGPEMGGVLSGLHEANGVELRCATSVIDVRGSGKVEHVELSDGTTLAADLVLVGIGARPATSWLLDSDIELGPDGGVVCDEFLESSVSGIYAAGDVAAWPNQVMGRQMRLEHWASAAEQGAVAARNAVAGVKQFTYETVPYFWSDWYGHRIQFVGRPGDQGMEIVSGTVASNKFTAIYRQDDRLIGALSVNEPRRIMKLRNAIGRRASWSEALVLNTAAPTNI